MLPLLPVNRLGAKKEEVGDKATYIPIIPPKTLYFEIELPTEIDSSATWYIVQTPRETKGVGGPYTIDQMREMYKVGDIHDQTLVWKEGEVNWKQIRYCDFLRSKLIQFPPIPMRISNNQPISEDVMELLSKAIQDEGIKQLDEFKPEIYCSVCGGIAISSIPHSGEHNPNYGLLAIEGGSTDLATEVLPGFLWIGNFASSKAHSLVKLKISLSINCTSDLPSLSDLPNGCRGKVFPLHDKPRKDYPNNMEQMMDKIDQACNWIDYERLYPDRITAINKKHQEFLQNQNVTHNKKTLSPKATYYNKTESPSNILSVSKEVNSTRILLWSKTGYDRACFLAIAYIIRRYGISLEKASDLVFHARPQMTLSRFYQNILIEWSKRRTLGKLLCYDCLHTAYEAQGDIHSMKKEEDLIYSQYDQVLATYDNDTTRFHHLGGSKQYLFQLLVGYELSSKWSGLCDLLLPGRNLGDESITIIVESLAKISVLDKLRVIDISGNQIHGSGVASLINHLTKSNIWELSYLNLGYNMLRPESGKVLSEFLTHINSVVSMDLRHNQLGDVGCEFLFQSLKRPAITFFLNDNNGPQSPLHHLLSPKADNTNILSSITYNNSLTDLNLSSNGMGEKSIIALISCLRDNVTLTRLDIGMNSSIPIKTMKQLFVSCKSLRTSIETLSVANTPLSIRTVEFIFKLIFQTGVEISDGSGNNRRISLNENKKNNDIQVKNTITSISTNTYSKLPDFESIDETSSENMNHYRITIESQSNNNTSNDNSSNSHNRVISNASSRRGSYTLTNNNLISPQQIAVTTNSRRQSLAKSRRASIIQSMGSNSLHSFSPNHHHDHHLPNSSNNRNSNHPKNIMISHSPDKLDKTKDFLLSKYTHGNHSIRHLNLSSCSIVSSHLLHLPIHSSSCTIRSLNLSLNKIGNEGIKILADCLLHSTPSGNSMSVVVSICLLEKLELSGCDISYPGFVSIMEAIKELPYLHYFDLSSNPIEMIDESASHPMINNQQSMISKEEGEEGGEKEENSKDLPTLIELFTETIQHCGLKTFKLNYCHLSSTFATYLFDAISGILIDESMLDDEFLLDAFDEDMMDNFQGHKESFMNQDYSQERRALGSRNLHEDNGEIIQLPILDERTERRLSNTSNNSRRSSSTRNKWITPPLTETILPTNIKRIPSILGSYLEAIYLTSNHISDSSVPSLLRCLTVNDNIQVVDLGYNKISDHLSFVKDTQYSNVTSITSHSSEDRKLKELHVNLIGNPCEQYALEVPGRARSKIVFKFGLHGSNQDLYNKGYSHLTHAAKEDFHTRREALLSHQLSHPPVHINQIF